MSEEAVVDVDANRELQTWRMLESMVWAALQRHPLPWRYQKDWTHEVIAADGQVVVKCKTLDDAKVITGLAWAMDHAAKEELSDG